MGQYYKFVNTAKQQESTVSLPFNFGLSWAKNLDQLSEAELKEKFDYVIEQNDWSIEDEIIAVGDYDTVLYYPRNRR